MPPISALMESSSMAWNVFHDYVVVDVAATLAGLLKMLVFYG
jgi:hypothetical protein